MRNGVVHRSLPRVVDRATGRKQAHPIGAWKQLIHFSLIQSGQRPAVPLRGQLAVRLDFSFPCPKKYRGDPQCVAAYKALPDIDNLAKGVLDALNAIAFDDDDQVVLLVVRRLIANDEPGVSIEIKEFFR